MELGYRFLLSAQHFYRWPLAVVMAQKQLAARLALVLSAGHVPRRPFFPNASASAFAPWAAGLFVCNRFHPSPYKKATAKKIAMAMLGAATSRYAQPVKVLP